MAEVLNLRVTLNPDGSMTANWDPISDIKRYKIYIRAVGASVLVCRHDDLQVTTYTSPAGLEQNKQYDVTLVAQRNSLPFTISDGKRILIPWDHYNKLPLDVPQNIKATATTNSVKITFDEVKRATGYDILFNGTTYSVKTTSKAINGLTPKTSYTYAVRAKNSSRTGDYSTTKTIKTLAVTPAVPQGILQTATENSVTISWRGVSTATSYDVLFNGTTYAVTGTSRTFTGLTAGKAYSYQIRSKNADGSSSYTSSRTVTTAPKAPTGITATSTDSEVTLTWNASEGAVSYGVKWNGQDVIAIRSPITFSKLESETTYSYQIRARSADGEGSYSSVRKIKTKVRPLDIPTGITKISTENTATIGWTAVSGATGYDILFGGRIYSTTKTTKNFTGLSRNTSYSFQIRAKNSSTTGEYCAAQTVQTTPATVTNSEAETTNSSVTISWPAVSGASSYDLVINGKTYNVVGTSKTVTGLNPNSSYSYQIRVNNADGSSNYSPAKTVKTAPVAPSNPTVSASSNSVTISWPAVAGATSYDLLFNGEVYRVTTTSKTIYGLVPGTSYSYAIRSNNADGTSAYSATKTIKTILTAPAVPTGISATSTTNSVTIQWSSVQGATSYDVMFAGQTYRVSSTSKTITGLAHSTTYHYSVRANNSSGSSSYSMSKAVTTQLGMPSAPTIVTASSTADTVTVSWSAVAGAASYDVLFNGTVYNVTSLSKTITGLIPSTNYNYCVRAKNSVGTSAYSTTKTITTQVAPPATPPTHITATATESSVTISWNQVDEATRYEILFDGKNYSTTSTSITINNLLYWTEYEYKICSGNAGGVSAYSEQQTIKTLLAVPLVPLGLVVTPDVSSIEATWFTVHAADSYELLINETVYPTTETEYVVTGLASGAEYRVSVRAKNSKGDSEYSSTLTVYTKLPIPANVGAIPTMNSTTIVWDPVEGSTSYEVEFDGHLYEAEVNCIEFFEVEPGSRHTYKVRAKNQYVTSDFSEEAYVRIKREIPEVPSNVWAEASLDSICVMWDPVERADSYEVRFNGQDYSSGGSSPMVENSPVRLMSAFSEVRSLSAMSLKSATSSASMARNVLSLDTQANTLAVEAEEETPADAYKIFYNLSPGTEYTFQVRASNESGSSEFSELQSILTQGGTAGWMPENGRNSFYLNGRIPNLGMDPVNPLTGAFVWSHTFLQDYGKDALPFTLMYDSKREGNPKVTGKKWTHSFNYQLCDNGDKIYFSTPYDVVVAFAVDAEDGSYQPMDGGKSGYTLTKGEGETYIVKAADGAEYQFDRNRHLSSIKEAGIISHQFTVNAEGKVSKVTGRYGGGLNFTYTGENLTGITNALNQKVTLSYQGDYLASVSNVSGKQMQFTHDKQGNLLTISDFSGEIYLTNTYDSKGRVTRQQLADRGESLASYNEKERSTTFTDELGNATKYHYDEQFRITSVEMAGVTIQNKYDEKGRLVEQIDGLGHSTKMSYDEKGRMTRVIHPDQSVEQVIYNENGRPTEIINQDGSKSSYEYDVRNNLVGATNERGNKGIYGYDAKDNLTSYQDKMGALWTYAYDEANHLKSARDSEGNQYTYEHDALGRLVSYTSPAGKTITYTYGSTGELLKITDPSGEVAFTYNENGNNTGITDALGNSQRVEYNAMGQVTLATDYAGNEYRFTYDAKGNLQTETDPLNFSVGYVYDARGNRISVTDKNGGTTAYTFNEGNQLIAIRDAAGGTIHYTYDTLGRIQAVTDARENQTGYTYDQIGRLTKVTNALGNTRSYAYDQMGNLLSQTDENGAVTRYEYDQEDRLTAIQSEAGRVLFTYDKLGRVVSIQDTDTHEETIHYDGDGKVTSRVNKENQQTTYVYDEAGRLIRERNALGAETTYGYDANGNCTTVVDAVGQRWSWSYNANGQVTEETNPLGQVIRYEYDERGMVKAFTDANGGKTTFAYDGNGNCIQEVNPDGGEKRYVYDAMNRLIQSQDEEGNRQLFSYDANGNLLTFTDANGNQWKYTYDALDQMVQVEDKNGAGLTFAYTKTGKLAAVTDQEGAKTSYWYDALGRLVEMADALDHQMKFTYDSQGRVLTREDARGNVTAYEYSPMGNLVKLVDGEGNETAWTYDALGRVLTKTNALGQTKTYAYDALGRVESIIDEEGGKTLFTYTVNSQIASVTDAMGNKTLYAYDANGNLIRVTDALGNVVTFAYDAMNNRIKECMTSEDTEQCITLYEYDKTGRMVKEINPLNHSKEYTYDGNGNLIRVLDEEGQESTLTYDLNNRPLTLQYGKGKQAAFRYNKRGELVELKDWNGVTSFVHDAARRLTQVTDPDHFVTGYRYDGCGNVTSITYPDGSVVKYGFDRNNRMNKVTDAEGKETRFTYDELGNVTAITQPGSSVAYAYNERNLPTEATYQFGDGSRQENRFTYDAVGRMLAAVRTGSTPQLSGQAEFAYDVLGRLTTYKEGTVTESYGYDALGNRTVKQVNGVEQATYQYNAFNQLVSYTEGGLQYSYGYDKRGNLTEEKRGDRILRQYLYDATGRMYQGRNRETGETTEYGYNGLLMRTRMVQTRRNPHGGAGKAALKMQSTSYVNDYLSQTHNELLTVQEGFGQTRTVYGPAYLRLSQKVTGEEGVTTPEAMIAANAIGKAYFQPDLWGSVRFAATEEGNVLRYGERNIWGKLKLPMTDELNTAGLDRSFGFTTYEYDPVMDKHYAKARFYDSNTGRMLAIDPIRRSLNGYPYCDDDPTDYVDPTGEAWNIIGGGLIGGLVGGTFGFVSSAVSQAASGQKVDWKKAVGSAANGAITGAVQGTLIGSGAGLGVSLAANFIGGTLGSAAEQQISTGRVDARKAVTSGITNAVSNAIYGTKKLTSFGDAFKRGMAAGAVTSGINYISDSLAPKQGAITGGLAGGLMGRAMSASYGWSMDPRSSCGATSPMVSSITSTRVSGYQYSNVQKTGGSQQSSGFSFGGLVKEMLIGGLTGGFASGTFYGIDKATQAISGSIRKTWGKGSNLMIEEMSSGRPQTYTSDLSYVTGKAARARNKAIDIIIKEDFPDLKLSYKPQYSPFIRTGVAKQNTGTQIGKKMFVSRAELRDTILHEELHHRWWRRGIIDHHPIGSDKEALFYKTLQAYKKMRGWK